MVPSMNYPPLLLLKYDDLCLGGCNGLLDNLHNNWNLTPGETRVGATIWLRLLPGPAPGWYEVLDVIPGDLPELEYVQVTVCVVVGLFIFCVMIAVSN